jgi:hypothetical protein
MFYKNIFKTIILLFSSIYAQDCILEVPNDPLNNGLFQPWFVSTNPISKYPCSQILDGSEVFVEATIFDIDNNNLYVYNPLVVDNNTLPAVQPYLAPLPLNNIVVIHFGTNGRSIKLIPSRNNTKSLILGNCINGLSNGTLFGHFAYCNAENFFKQINNNINLGLLIIPTLGKTFQGDICPTIRSFSVVDQDQSDNVITEYIITTDLRVAQNFQININKLNIMKIITNNNDNSLLTKFILPSIGCAPFMVSNLFDKNLLQSSLALNEIQANLYINESNNALIVSTNPMVIDFNLKSLEKINLYRIGVNQPIINILDINDGQIYCQKITNISYTFFKVHQYELSKFHSHLSIANNLLNSLLFRLIITLSYLNCETLTGNILDLNITTDPNTGIIISTNLNNLSSFFSPN